MQPLRRRTILRAGLATPLAAIAGCRSPARIEGRLIQPDDARVRATESARQTTGRTHAVRLDAEAAEIDLGGRIVTTWAYGGVVPGKEIRIHQGDVVEARLRNLLPAETTIHWHGIEIRNDMDGVPGLTQDPIQSGSEFSYRFVATTSGTHWFHPHFGVQLDRGLYAPLIVEDPREPAGYDVDWVIVLDDWIDGTGSTPDEVMADLRRSAQHMGHGDGKRSSRLLGGDAGDVDYPHYLINGRLPADPTTFAAKPGQRARIRFINAGGDTAFRVALGDHRMTITHTDGHPVVPTETGTVLIGMGERYDVLVTLQDGVFPLVALAEGKNATALALVRTGGGAPPNSTVRPAELDGTPVGYDKLQAAEAAALPPRAVDVDHRLELTGGMMGYDWGINGRSHDSGAPFLIGEGQRVRLKIVNTTMMWHPVHLHGHTVQVGNSGPRKDTVNVLPHQTVNCALEASNPGQWMLHCHNVYHAEAGMTAVLGYQV